MRPAYSVCCCILLIVSGFSSAQPGFTADWSLNDNPELSAFFKAEVERIERQNSLLNYRTAEEWQAAQPRLRQQLFRMLGLHPLPEQTPLQAVVTGTTEEQEFRTERLHFQSLPGLYVTCNLYLPLRIEQPLPAVLYVCGHGNVKKNGVSYGSKASYQRHGAWFARNGYVCLVIDTLQLGEIEGIHHGTYRYGRWWWNSRGYTPAGVEAWNCLRALDYLQSRPEIDGGRLGVTGRSGGGAYSWWLAALDERIQCAVPVAGITSLRNHVIDGCVEGHCDCMYMVNAARWDYATVAALVAPRPLLISNTDKDRIFPLDGVIDIHRQVRHIYELYGKPENLGLQITEGPHKDTQELHLHAFRWMNRHLRSDDSMIDKLAISFFEPEQLRVFSELPADERNTSIDESFIPEAAVPDTRGDADILRAPQRWLELRINQLQSECFAAWPDRDSDWQGNNEFRLEVPEPASVSADARPEWQVTRLHFESQKHVPLFVDIVHHRDVRPADISELRITILPDDSSVDIQTLPDSAVTSAGRAVALLATRGSGPHRWIGDERKQVQIQRRFQLLGMTVDGMRVWDIRRAVQLAAACCGKDVVIALHSADSIGNDLLCVCAALFEPSIRYLHLQGSQAAEPDGAVILNLYRVLHTQELLAMVLLNTPVIMEQPSTMTELAQRLSSNPAWNGRQLSMGR